MKRSEEEEPAVPLPFKKGFTPLCDNSATLPVHNPSRNTALLLEEATKEIAGSCLLQHIQANESKLAYPMQDLLQLAHEILCLHSI